MEKTRNKIYKMLIMLSVLFIANNTHGGTPITISFEQIEFNSGYILTLGDGTSNNTDLSEYFAFYLSSNRNSYVDLTISSNCTDPVTLIINANQSGSGLGNMCKVLYNYTISSGTPIELNFDGAVPSNISKYDYYWNWTITAIPCNTSAYDANTVTNTTHHCCYVLYDEPQAPMEEPWIEVLDYACSWASGQTSYNGAISAITNSLYSSGVTYNGSQHYTYPSYEQFHLTDLLYDIDVNINDVSMDCRDFANFSQVLFNAIGGNMLYYTFHNLNICGYYYGTPIYCFDYNYLLPAGPNSSPATGTWNFHQVGFWANKIVDASTMIDNDSDPTASPHTWKLSVGDMSENQYFDKLSEDVLSEIEKSTCVIY